MFGELGEDFSVQLDIRFFKAVYQLAVRYSVYSGCGVYFYLPQGSHISLFSFSCRGRRAIQREAGLLWPFFLWIFGHGENP